MRTLWLSLVLLSLPTLASAATGSLEKGVQLYESLEYEKAAQLLEAALADESAPTADRAKAAGYLGVIHLVLGREKAAREAFAAALRLDPSVQLPADASPAVRSVLEEVRATLTPPPTDSGKEPRDPAHQEEVKTERPPIDATQQILNHTPPEAGAGPLRIEVTLDPYRQVNIDEIVVHHRRSDDEFWFSVQATPLNANHWVAELPPPSPEAPTEYFIEAVGPGGVQVATVGSKTTPLTVPARTSAQPGVVDIDAGSLQEPSETPAPWYQRWYLWAGVGAAAAVVVGGIVLATSGGCNAPDGQGCVEVMLK